MRTSGGERTPPTSFPAARRHEGRRTTRTAPITQGTFSTAADRRPGPVTIEVVSASAAVVTLGGDHDVSSRDAISEAFGVAATGRNLLVDLSGCTFIDSTIIKLLLQTMRALEENDARLELVIDIDSHGHVARVAELMGIADVIPTHGSRSDGIRSLAGGGGAPTRLR